MANTVVLAGAIPKKAVISACYDLFKLSKPDKYDDILRSWYRLRLMTDGDNISMAKRSRDFKKHTESIDAVVGTIFALLFLQSFLIYSRFGMALLTTALRAYALLWAVLSIKTRTLLNYLEAMLPLMYEFGLLAPAFSHHFVVLFRALSLRRQRGTWPNESSCIVRIASPAFI